MAAEEPQNSGERDMSKTRKTTKQEDDSYSKFKFVYEGDPSGEPTVALAKFLLNFVRKQEAERLGAPDSSATERVGNGKRRRPKK
jgi:hypothetical protein